ncbi:hypothetical protein KKKH31_11390 [Helicobacter pylori]
MLHEPTQARLFEKPNDFGLSNPSKLGSIFLPHKLTNFLKTNAILTKQTPKKGRLRTKGEQKHETK